MKRLKSWFISAFITLIAATSIHALQQLALQRPPMGLWLGLLLAAAAPLAFFLWLFIGKPARTAAHPMGITVVSGLGVAIAMAVSWRYPNQSGMVYLWAAACFAGWWAYIRWYSGLGPREHANLAGGAELPRFTVFDLEGSPLESGNWRGQPHILIFYRGNWCPLCQAQIREIAASYRQLESLGAKIMFISPQPATHSARLAQRFEVPLNFLQDRNNQAAEELGIKADNGVPAGMQLLGYQTDTVLPTVLITDQDGIIRYSDLTPNYRLRPEVSGLLDALRKVGANSHQSPA